MNKQVYTETERITLEDYASRAEQFWVGTKDHDVSQNYRAFLEAINGEGAFELLDFGCGPGRDLKFFNDLGHKATGLDGCERFCEMAREHSGSRVLEQSFSSLNIGENIYDGIFANASLFHVPSAELPGVLKRFNVALKSEGVLFMSNPRGNSEGWNGNRFGNFMELETISRHLQTAGFKILSHYYRPENKPRQEQPWLALVSRKC